jgi:hemolysin activation/secretion protein
VGSTIFDRDQLNRFAQMIAMNPSDYASSDAIQNLCRQVLSQQDASKEALTTHPTLSNPTTSGEGVMGSGVTLADLTRVSDAITQCYTSQGYINSGAVISPDQLNTLNSSSSNTPIEVVIQIVEGSLEAINVNVSRPRGFLNTPLRASYVHQRLAGVSGAPFNVNKLVEAVQLLELDPVIDRISTRIVPGTRLGTSILNVEVTQADSFAATLSSNNDRSPSVGSVQQEATVSQANILGIGDRFNVGYTRTSGSDGVNLSYTLPVNAQNGTIQLAYGLNNSRVVEAPFDALDIRSDYHNYELSYRQPLVRSPNEEFALGLTASRQETTGDFLEALTGSAQPFPSRGADANGRTRLSALRFSQEWTKRGPNQVFALFSQLSLGLDLLDSTINASPPDSRFLAWQGQAQWVRQLAPDSLFLVRGSLQLADGPLVPLEQFGIGGDRTVRGYRSNTILADNGWLASAELRLPILRIPSIKGVLQIAPFFDAGGGWNNGNFDDPKPGTLVSTGLGLIWRMGDTLLARLDWGIPLISPPDRGGSLQESGIHFSISTSL